MSKGAYDVFALMINFLGNDWLPKHVTIDLLFEGIEIIGQTLARSLIELLNKYGLKKKIIVYVKDEGSNLSAMTITLKAIVNYESFDLEESFQGTCFGHDFSMACQYGTTKEKVCKDLKYVSIRSTHAYLQKCITWRKKSRKGKQEWNKACVETSICPKKLNTPMKTK
jgi:5'-3' exonuclease